MVPLPKEISVLPLILVMACMVLYTCVGKICDVKKTFLVVRFFFFVCSPSFSQSHLVKQWDHRFGGTSNDELVCMQQTSDGGYFLAGSSQSGIGGDKSQDNRGSSSTADFWIVKTDSAGMKQWDQRYGGSLDDELKSAQQTIDGGYIFGGSSRSPAGGDKSQANRDTSTASSSTVLSPTSDFWIVKTDSLGNKQWDKRFGGIYEDQLTAVIQTSDGGYLLGGYSYSGVSGDKSEPSRGSADYWIVKTDSSGSKQWDKRFGGIYNDQLYSIRQTTDGGYLLGGYSWSPVSGDKSEANHGPGNTCDYWIIKINPSGIQEWDHCYGGNENDELYSLQQTRDGGYVLAGYSWSGISGDKTQANFGAVNTSDIWMVKTDSMGVKQWDRDFGGLAREDEFGNVTQTTDGGYLIACTSYSDSGGTKSEDNLGIEQSWLIRTDSSGNPLWNKTIFTDGHDETGWAIQDRRGDYLVANYTNGGIAGYKSEEDRDSTHQSYDFMLVRFSDTTLAPVACFNASANRICQNTCISFSNLSFYGSSCEWIFPGATPATSFLPDPQNICYASAGDYDVTLIVTNAHGADTLVMHHFISVAALPQPFTIIQHADTLFAPSVFTGYQWYDYMSPVTGATNYFFIASHDGTYNVITTDSNGCSIGAGIEIENTGIVDAGEGMLTASVFPNPSCDAFHLTLNCSKPGTVSIEWLTLPEETIFENEFPVHPGENEMILHGCDLQDGIYFLRISAGGKKIMKKIILIR